MSVVVEDFIMSGKQGGFGVFEGDEIAACYSRCISSNQRLKWRRHGIVPAAFLNYLVAVGAVEKCSITNIPERKRTGLKVLDLLYNSTARNGEGANIIGVMTTALEKDLLPKVLLGSSEYVWDHAKVFGVKRN